MSYPPPLPFESQERLYQQAQFFYDEYEKMKVQVEESGRVKAQIEVMWRILREEGKFSAGVRDAIHLIEAALKESEK